MYFQQSAFISYHTKNPNTLFSTNYLLFREVYIKRSRIFFADLVLCNIYCEKPIFEKEFTTVRLITCGMLPCCCCFEASFLACCLLFEHFFWLLHFYFCKVEPSRRLWHTIIIWRVLFFKVQKYTMFNPCFSGHGRRCAPPCWAAMKWERSIQLITFVLNRPLLLPSKATI